MSKKLYQEMIIEHNKKPRNFGTIENPTHIRHGKNPYAATITISS